GGWSSQRLGRDPHAQFVSVWRRRSRSANTYLDLSAAAGMWSCGRSLSGAPCCIHRAHAGAPYRIGEHMRKLRALLKRVAGLLNSGRDHHEFSVELESHIAMHVEDGVRSGLSAEEARRRALIQLGGAEQVHQLRRERRTLPILENMARDVRYAVR